MDTPKGWQKNKLIRLFLLFGQSVEDSRGATKHHGKNFPQDKKSWTSWTLRVCLFRAGASRAAVSSKHHPGPSGLQGFGSRSTLRAGCLELTASALGSDQRPLPAWTPCASRARSKPHAGSAERPSDANRTGPEPPARPARRQPRARRAKAHSRPQPRRELLHLLFVSLRLWRGSGTAQDRDPDTDFSTAWGSCLPRPEVSTKLFQELSSHPGS